MTDTMIGVSSPVLERESAVIVCSICGDAAVAEDVQGLRYAEIKEFFETLGWAFDLKGLRVACPDHLTHI